MGRTTRIESGNVHLQGGYRTGHDIHEWEVLIEIRRQLLSATDRLAALPLAHPSIRYRDISSEKYRAASEIFWRDEVPEGTYSLSDKECETISLAIENYGLHICTTWMSLYAKDLNSYDHIGPSPDPRPALNPTFALLGFITDAIIPPPEFLIYLAIKFDSYADSAETIGNILFGPSKSTTSNTASTRFRRFKRDQLIYQVVNELQQKNPTLSNTLIYEKAIEALDLEIGVDAVRKIYSRFHTIIDDYDRIDPEPADPTLPDP